MERTRREQPRAPPGAAPFPLAAAAAQRPLTGPWHIWLWFLCPLPVPRAQIEIVRLDVNKQAQADAADPFETLAVMEHPYPATKIVWMPDLVRAVHAACPRSPQAP